MANGVREQAAPTGQTSAAPATDASGNAVIDPTQNVLDLVGAAIQRQDDLREAESRHVREIAGLRAEYAQELRLAETERINAIRQVDVEAVQRAAEVQANAQAILAAQVAAAAEAMRTQVQATATASQTGLAAALEPMIKDIADLRRAQYEAQGQKTQVTEAHTKTTGVGQWVAVAVSGAVGFVGILTAIVLAITR